MKKIIPAALIMILFAVNNAYSDGMGQSPGNSALSGIFNYDHPVRKAEGDKKWSFNLSGSYTGKRGNTETMRTGFNSYLQFDDNISLLRIAGVRAGYKREFDTHTKEYLEQNPLVKKTDSTFYCQAGITF
ncbi:MAG: hypothetical protein GXY14_00645 [Spirochaetes bacterium]|nr:hypothetical protein [Spirochaetota bacterium]